MNEGVPIAQDVRKCSGCREPIIWIKTAANDKFMPVNARPERRLVINAEGKLESVTTCTSHFATCEKAEDFR